MLAPLIQQVSSSLTQAARQAFPDLNEPVHVTLATQERFGHYQCNSAMQWAGVLKKTPREIAQTLATKLQEAPLFSKIEVAGPGFINLTLHAAFLSEQLDAVAGDSRLGVPLPKKKEKMVVEFSSPNIAKEMHVGHLRSTIIGDCLARLFEFLGHEVVRLNHIGDWGTAFGMLIAHMREEVPEVISGGKEADLSALMQWYRAAKKRFDDDQGFKERARLAVVSLQSGDAEALKAWEQICAISRKAFQEIYDLLDVELEERGESYYNPVLPEMIKDLEQKGLIRVSDGAKCLFLDGYKIPLMLQKSDGGFGYDTTDMAAMRERAQQGRADRIIIVTDAGQSLHFEMVYEAALKAGYLDPSVRFDHVPFGLVLGSDGKLRTRSGETEKLIDLLDAAVEEARTLLKARSYPDEELETLAPILGIDAVKYADLSCNRVSDYVFSYERMLRFEGNTAAFILYSYVRVAGIKRKKGLASIDFLREKAHIVLKDPSEISLALHLLRFAETLEAMAEDLLPNYMTDYLYVLAQKFNAFFRDCRVIGDPQEESRLLLCETVAMTLSRGLSILGLKTTEKM